jgi:hypothetical protein
MKELVQTLTLFYKIRNEISVTPSADAQHSVNRQAFKPYRHEKVSCLYSSCCLLCLAAFFSVKKYHHLCTYG